MSRGTENDIEETREVHVFENNNEDTRDDPEQNTISSVGDSTVGREEEEVRAAIRNHFFHNPAYVPPPITTNDFEATMTMTEPTENEQKVSSPSSAVTPVRGRPRRNFDQRNRRGGHSNSPNRRMRSTSRSPKVDNQVEENTFTFASSPRRSPRRSPRKAARSSPSPKKAQFNLRKHDDDSGGSSDEALEFTKERYKRLQVPDIEKKGNSDTPLSPMKKPNRAKFDSDDDSGLLPGSINTSSSEYESSINESMSPTEKERLREKLKRRALLKYKAEKASSARTGQSSKKSVSFIDNDIAFVAADFVSKIVEQLGLPKSFDFFGGESNWNDEYNLLRWDDDDDERPGSKKNGDTETSLFQLSSWDDKKYKDTDDEPGTDYTDDDTEGTERVGQERSKTLIVSPRANEKDSRKEDPPEDKAFSRSGPANINEKEIAEVVKQMTKMDNGSISSYEGYTDESVSTKPNRGGLCTNTELCGIQLPGMKDENPPTTTVSMENKNKEAEDDGIVMAISSDTEEKRQRQKTTTKTKNRSFKKDDDATSLTYSVEDGTVDTNSQNSNRQAKGAQVANLVAKFEESLHSRSSQSSSMNGFSNDDSDKKATSADLAIALSLSGDGNSLASPVGDQTYPLANEICHQSSPDAKAKEVKTTIQKLKLMSDDHIEELQEKIKESHERRAKSTNVLEDTAQSTKKAEVSVTSKSDTEKVPAKNNGPDLEALAKEIGRGFFGESAKNMDMDNLLLRLDDAIRCMIKGGKLPGLSEENTVELLKNLSVLRRRRGIVSIPKDALNLLNQTDRAESTTFIHRIPNPIEITTMPTPPSPPTPPPRTPPVQLHNQTYLPTQSVNPNVPMSNLARIRARRDEAAMRIREQTERLTGQKSTTPTIPTASTDFRSQYTATPVLSAPQQPVNTLSKNQSKPKGPPRPEDMSGLRRSPLRETTTDSIPTMYSMNHRSYDNYFGGSNKINAKSVPMSNSDMDMEMWERTELQKLDLMLNKSSEFEPQSSSRSMANFDNNLPMPTAAKTTTAVPSDIDMKWRYNPSSHQYQQPRQQQWQQTKSMIDYNDSGTLDGTVGSGSLVDTDNDSDSDSDTFGSESDSERLERIALMVEELRLRRRTKRR
jgi:hypothetical protein